MRFITRVLSVVATTAVLFTAPILARAEAKLDTAAAVKSIAPFVNADTLVVMHADVAQVDLDAFQKWASGIAEMTEKDAAKREKNVKEMSDGIVKAKEFVTNFQKAGGHDVFFVVNLGEGGRPLGLMVVPVPAGGDAKAIQEMGTKLHKDSAEKKGDAAAAEAAGVASAIINDAVVFVDTKEELDAVKAIKPADNAIIAPALDAAANSAVQVVLTPSDNARNMAAGALSQSPLGGMVQPELLQTISWISLGANSPPNNSISLRIQSPDATSANKLNGVLTFFIGAMAQQPNVKKEVIAALTPKVDGDHHTILLSAEQVNNLIKMSAEASKGADSAEPTPAPAGN